MFFEEYENHFWNLPDPHWEDYDSDYSDYEDIIPNNLDIKDKLVSRLKLSSNPSFKNVEGFHVWEVEWNKKSFIKISSKRSNWFFSQIKNISNITFFLDRKNKMLSIFDKDKFIEILFECLPSEGREITVYFNSSSIKYASHINPLALTYLSAKKVADNNLNINDIPIVLQDYVSKIKSTCY